MITLRSASLALVATLALAACNSKDDGAASGEIAEGKPVAAVPAPAGQSWSDVAAFTPEGGVVEGNPNAPIKLVEYASHTCSHCAEFSEHASEAIRSKYVDSGKVSYEIRNQIHDPIDLTFAVLARCAGPEAFHAFAEQGWTNLAPMFETFNANKAGLDAAMQQQGAARFDGIAQSAGLYDFFAQRGVSRDQAKTCLAKTETATKIAANSDSQSQELNVTGTPTFFINGNNVGTQTWETLEPMLQRAGAR
jgi:protein-disulfide isomerase